MLIPFTPLIETKHFPLPPIHTRTFSIQTIKHAPDTHAYIHEHTRRIHAHAFDLEYTTSMIFCQQYDEYLLFIHPRIKEQLTDRLLLI